MNKKYIYVLTITYSFDDDYYAKKFDTYEEAIKYMNQVLQEERATVIIENDYEPSIIRYSVDNVVFIYEEDIEEDYYTEDRAYYRIFEVEI